MDPQRVVFVESESRKVGNVSIAESLMLKMRASDCIRVDAPMDLRVALLMEDYPFFVQDTEFFCARLQTLVDLRGHEVVQGWCALARAGETREVVRQLLEMHYDPGYAQSTHRNYARFGQATVVTIDDISEAGLRRVAQGLVAASEGP